MTSSSRPAELLTALVVMSAILLGGGTRQGFTGDVVVQVLSAALLVAIIGGRDYRRVLTWLRLPLFFVVLVALLQLMPWGWLVPFYGPGHGLAVSGLDLIGASRSATGQAWALPSLTPTETWAGLVSVLPAIAVFAALSVLSHASRMRIGALILALIMMSVLLGFAQVAQGPQSGLRLFEFTNVTEAVGFFANRNHFATLLCAGLIIALIWFARAIRWFRTSQQGQAIVVLSVFSSLSFLLMLLSALALARSRAGVVLAMIAFAAFALILFLAARGDVAKGRLSPSNSGPLIMTLIIVPVLFAAQVGLARLLTRFGADPLADLRVPLFVRTFEVAGQSLPWGTGLGSFPTAFLIVEQTSEAASRFANRAHNDWLELSLELGVVGVIISLAFAAWFARTSQRAWRALAAQPEQAQLELRCVASVIILLILIHSSVDYPLRTTAISVVFGFACGMLLRPPDEVHGGRSALISAEEIRDASIAGNAAQHSQPAPPRHAQDPSIELKEGERPFRSWTGTDRWPAAWRDPTNNSDESTN